MGCRSCGASRKAESVGGQLLGYQITLPNGQIQKDQNGKPVLYQTDRDARQEVIRQGGGFATALRRQPGPTA